MPTSTGIGGRAQAVLVCTTASSCCGTSTLDTLLSPTSSELQRFPELDNLYFKSTRHTTV
jgi:hypothetical protein